MKIILDEQYTFSPKDDKTNFYVNFHVPHGYNFLRCECCFSPKVVSDKVAVQQAITANIGKYVPRESLADMQFEGLSLVNHLTFSMDYEDVYLGCAHRHDAKAVHIFSNNGSSPGFICHGAKAGLWRAGINIHSITSAKVKYSLKISAHVNQEVANGI